MSGTAALTKWLPGRSATGLKQAHIAHVQGNEAKAAALLKAQGWPRDLTGLLAAWPGPLPQLEVSACGVCCGSCWAAKVLH